MNPQLQQAELAKRSSELDAREAFLDEKLKLLESAPVNLKVYDARTLAKENQLKVIEDRIGAETDRFEKLEIANIQKLRQSDIRLKETQSNLKDMESAVEQATHDYEQLTLAVHDTNKELKERKAYLIEQEKVIAEKLEQGNEALLDINEEIGKLQLILQDNQLKAQEAQEDLEMLVIATHQQKEAQEAKVSDYESKILRLQDQITKLETRLAAESGKSQRVITETDGKLRLLKEKEESMIARQDAIRLEKQELDRDRQRFQNTRDLYNNAVQ